MRADSFHQAPSSAKTVIGTVSAWYEPVPTTDKECWEEDKRWRDDCTRNKKQVMMDQWMEEQYAINIIDVCKTRSKNAGRCVELITHLRVHETGRGKNNGRRKYNNPFGFMRNWYHMQYSSVNEALKDFVDRFNSYWYNKNCTTMVTLSKYTATQQWERINNCKWLKDRFAITK